MAKALTNEELKILELFRASPLASYNIMEIGKKLGKASYDWTFRAVKKLNQQGVLSIESRGGSSFCSINLGSNLALAYMALLEQMAIPAGLPMKNIQKLLGSMPASYFTFMITGSYARGKATPRSDLDIVIITENKNDARKAETILGNEGGLMIPKAHIFAFSREEFLQMLLDKRENYGKEAYRNRLILAGAESYYRIIGEAVGHGFRKLDG